MTAPTLEQAVAALHPHAWHEHERARAVSIATRLKLGIRLSDEQRRNAARLLQGYQAELAAAGINLAQIDAAVTDPAVTAARVDAAPPEPSAATASTVRHLPQRDMLLVKSPWALKAVMAAQSVGAWDKRHQGYLFPATPHGALAIRDTLARFGISDLDGPEGTATRLLAAAQQTNARQVYRSREDLPPIPNSTYPGWTHQRQAFWFCVNQGARMLDCEMGTGKSKIVIDVARESGAQSMLIMCPERVVGVWPNQFRQHNGTAGVHIIDPRRETRSGTWQLVPIAERVDLYEHALHECRCGLPHVLISNYAAAAHEPFASWSTRQRFDLLAYDEAHRLRSPTGVWSKWAEKMVKTSGMRIGGTGTLQAQSPMDVFGPFRAIEPGIFGSSVVRFRAKYAIMGGFGPAAGKVFQGIQPEMLAEFTDKIGSITYVADESVLDLPEQIPDVPVLGQMKPAGMKIYLQMKRDAYVAIAAEMAASGNDLEAAAPNALVQYLRLCQLTGGWLRTGEKALGNIEDVRVDGEKQKLLADDLEDLPAREPVIVFCQFHHDLDAVAEVAAQLGRPYRELSGRRDDAINRDGQLADDVVIAGVQLQSGGTGIDFTRSSYAIYYSVSASLADYLQSRKRLLRPGQTSTVRYRHLIMQGTVNEIVYAALAARESVTVAIKRDVLRLQAAGKL